MKGKGKEKDVRPNFQVKGISDDLQWKFSEARSRARQNKKQAVVEALSDYIKKYFKEEKKE